MSQNSKNGTRRLMSQNSKNDTRQLMSQNSKSRVATCRDRLNVTKSTT